MYVTILFSNLITVELNYMWLFCEVYYKSIEGNPPSLS
jgi:hypothetical protein